VTDGKRLERRVKEECFLDDDDTYIALLLLFTVYVIVKYFYVHAIESSFNILSLVNGDRERK
jgi:hypothetical protein